MTQTAALPRKVRDTYSSVLLPVDFTSLGWRALPLADRLSNVLEIPLQMVHVDTASPWRADGSSELQLRAAPFGREVQVHVVADGDVGHGIGEMAAKAKTLVVMATHAHTGAGEMVAGSSVEEVLHAVDGPIVTVGPRFRRASTELRRILACMDAGVVSDDFIQDIASWSTDLGLPVELLTVTPRVPAERFDDPGGEESRLWRVADELTRFGVDVHPLVLRGSRPGHEIVDFADQVPGTLIALTTHARAAGPRALLGSVGMKVVRRSQNPVLLRRRTV